MMRGKVLHGVGRSGARARRVLAPALLAALAAAGCSETREESSAPATWEHDVQALFSARCASCHEGATPAGGVRATEYLGIIACGDAGAPLTLQADGGGFPLLEALASPTHAGLLSADELALVRAWIGSGAPAFRAGVHDPGFIDPRSPLFHGKVLRDQKWAQMLDPAHPDACGRCHDGAPTRPSGVTAGAVLAPSCTSCHTAEKGPLACGTCHGDGSTRAYPPRDPCLFPDGPKAGAHAAHVNAGPMHAEAYACTTCHVLPGDPIIGGTHANGTVDVVLDPALAGDAGAFDASSKTCTVRCHLQGGLRQTPAWLDAKGPMTCNDCHKSPPDNHSKNTCDKCHRSAQADGKGLVTLAVHLNGKVDLGDDSGKCGACHGQGDSPAPATGAHAAHVNPGPAHAQSFACTACHPTPTAIKFEGTHGNGQIDFAFDPTLAGDAASFDSATKTCTVRCHAQGGLRQNPAWTDTAHMGCNDCHKAPPENHYAGTCDFCHHTAKPDGTGLVSLAVHVNGTIDLGDGSGKCGACHGQGDSAWPSTGAHAAHANPGLSSPIACTTCHVVPQNVKDPGHLHTDTTKPELHFGGLAAARGATPSWDGTTCTNVACHGFAMPGGTLKAPAWQDKSGAPAQCGACHAAPPPAPHTTLGSCESLLCHGGEISRTQGGAPAIAPEGRGRHVDGTIEVGNTAP